MTLKSRFSLLMGLLLAALLVGLWLLRALHRREASESLAAAQRERSGHVDRVITMAGFPLQLFSRDYSLWDDMVTFVEKPDPAWAATNIDAALENFRLGAAWVLRPDGSLVYAAAREMGPPDNALPVGVAELLPALARDSFARFFVRLNGVLYEVHAAPIQPSTDVQRTSSPRGWLLGAWAWDHARLATLSDLAGGKMALVSSDHPAPAVRQSGGVRVQRELHDIAGRTIAKLEIHYTSPELAAADDVNRTELLIFVGHGALVLLLMLVCLQLWVLRPVAKIASSLRSRDASELQPLLGRSDETGGMARVVVDHFEDQTALKRNEQILADALEERIRLGRDLHDGVIQSLFAAGMSLSSTRDLIRQDPARAERAVDEMRDRLNDIIRDVRAFIVGMEPEFLRQKTFAEAVHALIEALCHVRLISVKTDLPEALGEKLSGDQKIHALQLIRELLLHCLRHDHTTALSLALSTAPDGLTLSFQGGDDGFEGGNSQISNTGIATIAARARASRVRCDVFTSSGQAARVAVRYPPAPSTSNP